MRKFAWRGSVGLGLAGILCVSTAPAWWVKGHESITEAAVARLPEEMPAFFRGGGKAIAHCAGDPDRWKNRGTPHLGGAEGPHHFIDLEDYEGKEIPDARF